MNSFLVCVGCYVEVVCTQNDANLDLLFSTGEIEYKATLLV